MDVFHLISIKVTLLSTFSSSPTVSSESSQGIEDFISVDLRQGKRSTVFSFLLALLAVDSV